MDAVVPGCRFSAWFFFCLPTLIQSEWAIRHPEPLGPQGWFSVQACVSTRLQIPVPESSSRQPQARAPPTREALFSTTPPPSLPPSQRWGSPSRSQSHYQLSALVVDCPPLWLGGCVFDSQPGHTQDYHCLGTQSYPMDKSQIYKFIDKSRDAPDSCWDGNDRTTRPGFS